MTTSTATTITTITTNGGLKHYHDEDMQSFSLKNRRKPLDPDKFFPWIQKPGRPGRGQKILRWQRASCRSRTIPSASCSRGVHMILDGDHQRPWKDGEEAREAAAVFIGRREMPEEMIRKGFSECVA